MASLYETVKSKKPPMWVHEAGDKTYRMMKKAADYFKSDEDDDEPEEMVAKGKKRKKKGQVNMMVADR